MKIYKVVVLFCFISSMLQAQDRTKIDFGIRLGGNISAVSHENRDFFNEKRMGLTGGLFAQIPLNNKLIFQLEVAFVQKGDDHKSDVPSNLQYLIISDPRTFSYLEIPIQIMSPLNEYLSVYGGLSPAFLFKATRDITFGENKPHSSHGITEGIEDVTEMYNLFDLGLNLGLNVSITDHFILDARYTNGLTSILKKAFEDSSREYHQIFSFSLGYII